MRANVYYSKTSENLTCEYEQLVLNNVLFSIYEQNDQHLFEYRLFIHAFGLDTE